MVDTFSKIKFRGPTDIEQRILEEKDREWEEEIISDWIMLITLFITAMGVMVSMIVPYFTSIFGKDARIVLTVCVVFSVLFMIRLLIGLRELKNRRQRFVNNCVLVCSCNMVSYDQVGSGVRFSDSKSTYIKVRTENGNIPGEWFYWGENIIPSKYDSLLMIRYSATDCVVTALPENAQYEVKLGCVGN